MTDPYIYTDSDGVLLSIGPMPDPAVSGAWLTLSRADLHIASGDAPAVCARILAAAGRSEVRVVSDEEPGAVTARPDLDAIAARVDANAADPITLVESTNLSLWRRSAITWSDDYDDWERPTSYDRGALLLDVDPDDERDRTATALADLVQATEDRAALLVEVRRLTAELATARREERERCARYVEDGVLGAGSTTAGIAAEIRALPDEDTLTPDAYETAMRTNPENRPVKDCPDGDPHDAHSWDDARGHPLHCPGEPARTTTEET